MSGLIYLFTVYTDESCSYYGNRSQPVVIMDGNQKCHIKSNNSDYAKCWLASKSLMAINIFVSRVFYPFCENSPHEYLLTGIQQTQPGTLDYYSWRLWSADSGEQWLGHLQAIINGLLTSQC